MQYETLDGSDVDRIMRGDSPHQADGRRPAGTGKQARGTVIQPSTDLTEPDVQPGGLGGGPLPARDERT